MTVTIPDVMRHVRNHFVTGCLQGEWQTDRGRLHPADQLRPGEWIAITEGPLRGVRQLDEYGAIPGAADTAWTGRVFLLEPPEDFIRLCGEIGAWAQAHADPTLLTERFGAYSRSHSSGDWTRVFARALAPYKRMYAEVNL